MWLWKKQLEKKKIVRAILLRGYCHGAEGLEIYYPLYVPSDATLNAVLEQFDRCLGADIERDDVPLKFKSAEQGSTSTSEFLTALKWLSKD